MTGIITAQQRVIGGPTSGDHRRWVYEQVQHVLSREIAARLIDGREYVVQQAKEPTHRLDGQAELEEKLYPGCILVQMWATVFLRRPESAEVGDYVVREAISVRGSMRQAVIRRLPLDASSYEIEEIWFTLERIRIEDRTIEAWRRVE